MRSFLFHTALVVLLSFGALGGLCPSPSAGAESSQELEYKLKAAFLFNFARFTQWPNSANNTATPFVFCVLGKDPFGVALSGLQERSIGDKAIKLHYAENIPDGIDQCQVLFVSKSEIGSLQRILSFTKGKPIVTVSDIEGFAEANGMFEFINTEGKLSFIINNSIAQNSGIHISSSLLNLASKVE